MFKYFAIIICSALFLYMMIDVWDKYDKKMTSMGTRFKEENNQEKHLPCITVCPWNAFRKRGLYFKRADYISQTFEKEEIFYNDSGVDLYNESLYYVEEIHSIFLGRCYMACHLKPLPRKTFFFFYLRKYRDYKSNHDIV